MTRTNRIASKATTSRAALAAALLGALAAPVFAPAPALAAGEDTIVIARDTDFNSLDPARAWCDSCQIYMSSVYETMISVNPKTGAIEPRLATSWEVNDDQTEFTFHLDPDAVFSDGSPVEAKDLKWTIERLRDLKEGPSFFVGGVETIETPDAHTLVIRLNAPDSEFMAKASAPYVVAINSDVAIKAGASGDPTTDRAEPWFLQNSAGSGPYVLESYRPDDELRLALNPHHKSDKSPLPVVIRDVKDAVGQAQMLENGGADIAMQVDTITAQSVRSPDVVFDLVPSYNMIYVALSPGAKDNEVPLTPKIREAFGYALDYEGILEYAVGGDGDLQASPIPNGFPGSKDLPLPHEDLDKARALLAEAGVPDGFPLKAIYPDFNLYGVDLNTMMQKVQQDLARVGIEVSLQPVTFAVWGEEVNASGIPLTALFYAPDYFGSGQYFSYFTMTPDARWYQRAGGDKAEGLKNERELELMAEYGAAGPDDVTRLAHELGLEMIKDRIIFPLVNPRLVLGYRKGVTGVAYSVCCQIVLEDLGRE
ncbi:ABC transporter substrate-binding protein [Pikeienuella sp. HZG-20]|uniref:ABC transporter substrate-binding protein n=1 Tax=Paludibacillus litoralis TaxID=3133267 RepID=UPI0030EF4EA0